MNIDKEHRLLKNKWRDAYTKKPVVESKTEEQTAADSDAQTEKSRQDILRYAKDVHKRKDYEMDFDTHEAF